MTESTKNPSPPDRSWIERIFLTPDERRLRAGWRLLGQAFLFGIFAAISVFLLFPLLPEGRPYLLAEGLIRLVAVTKWIIF